MKITKIETKILKAPLKRPFHTALRSVESLEDIVVLIHTDSGHVGYGEGAPTPKITGETIATMRGVIEYLTPFLLDKTLEEFDTMLRDIHNQILKNTTAKAALEIALYDLKAQSQALPLYKILGGEHREFETDITISLGTVEDMIADSLVAINEGYKILKIKVGESIQGDIDRVQAIHQVVGDDVKLRLDANQGWSVADSIKIMHTLEGRGIALELLEQPIAAENIYGLKAIKEQIATPILADEAIFTVADTKRVLEIQAANYINIKLSKSGGISNALKIAEIAGQYGVKAMMGCMLEGPISLTAALHVASAKADIITMLDLDAVSLLKYNPIQGGALFEHQKMTLNNTAGLGCRFLR